MKQLSLFFALALVLASGASAIVIPVTGGSIAPATTLQDALDTATAGDIVEIQDSLVYNEDIGLQINGVTLRAAAGQTPTVNGQYIRSDISDFAFLGGLALGFACVISADDITIEGIHFDCENPATAFLGQFSGCLSIEGGTNVTIRNCDIEYSAVGPNGIAPNDANQPCLAIVTSFLNSAAGFLAAGDPIDNVLMEDCQVHNSALGFYMGDLQGALGGFGVGPTAPAGPPTNVTIRNCDFSDCNGSLIEMDSVDPLIMEDCLVHDTQGGFEIGGGTYVLRRVVLTDVLDGQGVDLDGEDGVGSTSIFTGAVIDMTIEDSIICSADSHGIEAIDVDLTVTGSIITNNGENGLWWRPDNWDADFLPARGGATVPANCVVDQCDIYQPNIANAFTTSGAINETIVSANNVTITNSILTADVNAINNVVTFTAPTTNTLIATNNDLFAPTSIVNTGGATLTDTANLNEDPGYVFPPGCPDGGTAAAFFSYTNQTLATAGDSGQAIGSQGAVVPPNSVDDWTLYN